MPQLTVGAKAPAFTLVDQNGNKVKLSDFKGKKVLLYFYPRANTPGCTKQSCAVRDAGDELEKLGVARIGISPDKPETQKKFADKYDLDFPLLSDADHATAEKYGAWGEKKSFGKTREGVIRSSFLVDEKGKLLGVWYKVKPDATAPNALATLAE